MSLSKPSTGSIIKKQLAYKNVAYLNHLLSLIFMQLFAILFSFAGVYSHGSGNEMMYVEVKHFSADGVISFTMLWAVITGIYLTTKSFRYDDFAFVTNRLASNISNSLFLAIASLFAGTTAMLSTFFHKVILYFLGRQEILATGEALPEYYQQFFVGMGATILYVFMFCAVGYFIGSLVQVHKGFISVFAALFFLLIVLDINTPHLDFLDKMNKFYFQESSFLLFLIKTILTSMGLFAISAAATNRLEVKR